MIGNHFAMCWECDWTEWVENPLEVFATVQRHHQLEHTPDRNKENLT